MNEKPTRDRSVGFTDASYIRQDDAPNTPRCYSFAEEQSSGTKKTASPLCVGALCLANKLIATQHTPPHSEPQNRPTSPKPAAPRRRAFASVLCARPSAHDGAFRCGKRRRERQGRRPGAVAGVGRGRREHFRHRGDLRGRACRHAPVRDERARRRARLSRRHRPDRELCRGGVL